MLRCQRKRPCCHPASRMGFREQKDMQSRRSPVQTFALDTGFLHVSRPFLVFMCLLASQDLTSARPKRFDLVQPL